MTASPVDAALYQGSPSEWDAFVAIQPAATASHQFAWKRVVESVYQHDCPYLATYQGDALNGVLPLVDVRSLAFGRFLVSMPYLNAGGPLGGDQAAAALTERARDLAEERRASILELRCTEERDLGLETVHEKVTCVLDLKGTAEQVWSTLPSKLRSQIRRPGKEGVEVHFGEEQIRPFFSVFAHNMRDLGSPTHPQQFFRAIARELGASARFGCAYYRGKPIAGGCALVWRDEMEMTWASSLREHSVLSANMLLYWAFIERAATEGLTRFNFGRCTPNTGSHRFKRQWGAVDYPLPWHRAVMKAGAATPRREEGSLSLATRLWQHVPVPLATAVGSRLRGGIPS